LLDVSDGTIAWTQAFERSDVATDRSAAEDEIVVSVADALLQFYGVVFARDRVRQLASPAGDPRYRCVLDTTEYIRSYEMAAYDRVRSCLERLTSIDPSFAIGFELLAILYVRESNLDLAARVGDPPALDRALRAARRAIELNPASARAYLGLFVVLYSRGDVAAAFAAGDKALALNPYDLITVGEYGGRLIMTGEVERGMKMLKRVGDAGSIRPSLQHFYLFLGNYLQGDMKEAAFHAEQITTDDFPYGLVIRAIAANRAGNDDQARMALKRLVEVQPAWRNDARGELAKQILKPEIVDSLLRDLAAAGLAGAR
jgi:tetratricopeptide (TPR) repeat protein